MEKHRHPVDTGYSWVTVLGAAIGMFFSSGGVRSVGIIFVEVSNKFEASQGLTALMIGVIAAGMSICSPFMMAIAIRHSMRAVVMSGGLLMAIAALLCSLAPNVYYVIFVFGLLTGAACGCIFAPSLVIVGQYFHKRRSVANGLAMAGASLGQLTLPFVVTYLFGQFNFQGALLVYGAVCLHIVIGGALMRPTSFYERKNVKSGQIGTNTDCISSEKSSTFGDELLTAKDDTTRYNKAGSLNLTGSQTMGRKDTKARLKNADGPVTLRCQDSPIESTTSDIGKKRRSCCVCCVPSEDGRSRPARKVQCITYDTSVLKNYLFMVYLLGTALGSSFLFNMITFLPARATDYELQKETGALLLSISGGTDFLGRIIGGWFADLGLVKRSNQMGIGLIVAATIGLVCAFFDTFSSLVILSVTIGLVGGIYTSLMPAVLVDFLGQEKFPSAFGLTIMCIGLFNLTPPGIFGKIRDVTGSYTIPYCLCSAMLFIGGSAFLLEPFVRKLQERKDRMKEMAV